VGEASLVVDAVDIAQQSDELLFLAVGAELERGDDVLYS
jgi:hypothetical protein